MMRTSLFGLAATIVLLVGSQASAGHHWEKRSVMNNTGAYARPTWGFGTPTQTWGWFGVHYWPRHSWSTGYYGDKREWGYRQGY